MFFVAGIPWDSRGPPGNLPRLSGNPFPGTFQEPSGNRSGSHPGTSRELLGNSFGVSWGVLEDLPGTSREYFGDHPETSRGLPGTIS